MNKNNSDLAHYIIDLDVFFRQYISLSKSFTGIRKPEDLKKEESKHTERLVQRPRMGTLWGMQTGTMCFCVDKKSMQDVKRYLAPLMGNIEAIYQDSNRQFWVGSFGGGLMSLDPKDWSALFSVNLGKFRVEITHSITEWWDRHHHRWLACRQADNGLIMIDPISLKSRESTFHLGLLPEQFHTQICGSVYFC